ncbi:MAG: hypothetical protein KGH98_02300 [Candidatus Micrarchaeota archaeon]|nr:hypothetical protein [Candidatus Micrarchaeota archaeon]
MSLMRQQSALEYLVTYGWALVIIAVAAVLLYAYINSPGQVTSSSCNFVQGAYCNDMVLGTNITTHQTVVAFYLTNIQEYPIESPTIYSNVNGTNSTGNACKPNFVLAGGSIICILNLPITTTLGALVSGNVYLKAKYCGLVNIPNSAASCAAAPYQTFLGSFVGHAQPVVNPNVTLSITANTLRPPANNQKDALFVHVKLLGYPLNAATVNLTTNHSGYTLSPNPVRSNTTGIALSYINSTIVGNVIVTANYSGTLANITLDFLPVSYIGFGLPSYSGSVCGTSPIITIDGTNYDYAQLTSQLSFATGSSHNYCIISPACSNGNTQYVFNSIVIGGVTYTNQCGIINVNGNTTVVILPITQYHLSESANPSFGGTASPGNGWFNSGNAVTINELTNPGWFFNGWTGSPYAGASASNTFIITAPATETAGFYSTTTTTTTSTSTSTTSTSTSTTTSTTTIPCSGSTTGGSVSFASGNQIFTFTANGTFTYSGTNGYVAALVVAGGGGGGGTSAAGGGGGGGFQENDNLAISPGAYTVTVGAGGAAAGCCGAGGGDGSNSVFSTITSVGGGGGSGCCGIGPYPGGSGGGAANGGGNGASGIVGQGNNGGASTDIRSGGGGGGAGAVGGTGFFNGVGNGGPGGAGLSSTISGSTQYYAGGGGGGNSNSGAGSAGAGGLGGGGAGGYFAGGSSATPNTGGGGGGGGANNGGGAGGSGIVIIAINSIGSCTP